MKHNLTTDFSVNKESRTITVKRSFAAPQDLVWDAFTKKEILDKWWAPKPWAARTKSMDFTVGGHWLYAMVGPDGTEQWCYVGFKSITPKEQFSGTDAFSDSEGNVNKEMPVSVWTSSFHQNGELTDTQFVLQFDDLAQLEKIVEMGFKEGFGMTLDALAEMLEGKQ